MTTLQAPVSPQTAVPSLMHCRALYPRLDVWIMPLYLHPGCPLELVAQTILTRTGGRLDRVVCPADRDLVAGLGPSLKANRGNNPLLHAVHGAWLPSPLAGHHDSSELIDSVVSVDEDAVDLAAELNQRLGLPDNTTGAMLLAGLLAMLDTLRTGEKVILVLTNTHCAV